MSSWILGKQLHKCKYYPACPIELKLDDDIINSHEENCEYRHVFCNHDDCSWEGYSYKLEEHELYHKLKIDDIEARILKLENSHIEIEKSHVLLRDRLDSIEKVLDYMKK